MKECIGRDREEWRAVLDDELQSLYKRGAVHEVDQALDGREILQMKMVVALKPVPDSLSL